MRDDPLIVPDIAITPRDFLWAVGSLCNMQRRVFDATLVQREFPPPHSALTLVDALRSLEMAARIVQRDRNRITRGKLPCLVFLKPVAVSASVAARQDAANGHAADEVPTSFSGIALLVKAEDNRLLMFPAGTNVEFAHVESADTVRIVIWERGVGPTTSSGTGSSASAVAAASHGGASRDLQVIAPGGTQRVEWREDGVYLTGWAELMFDVNWLLT